MGIELPTKKKMEVPHGFPEGESWLLFGAPKSKKTTLLSQWPECLILNTEGEGNTKYITDAYVSPVASLAELGDVYAQLAAMGDEIPYQTVGIDTIDVVNDWAEDAAVVELGIKEMGDGTYGADWGRSRTIVLNVIKQFSNLPVNLVIVAHSRWAIVNEVNVGHTIDLPGKLARFTMANIDNILFTTTDKKGEPKVVFRPTKGIEAGSRNPVLAIAGECECSFGALKALFKEEGEE